jgi:GNAT superfamily N-acetyltransferase
LIRRAEYADLAAIIELRREWTRNRGIGSQLVSAALSYADQNGFVRVVLSPTERSIPLYERAGFGPADALMLRTPPPWQVSSV